MYTSHFSFIFFRFYHSPIYKCVCVWACVCVCVCVCVFIRVKISNSIFPNVLQSKKLLILIHYKRLHHASTIIIIIIIMSCRQHGYPWPSPATSPYHSSLLAGFQGYIPYPHIAAVCMFELVVLLLLGHMRRSIGVHNWWARPCFSSSVLRVWFVQLAEFSWWEASGRIVGAFWGVAARTCSILLSTFLCNYNFKCFFLEFDGWLVGWLVGFNECQHWLTYLIPNMWFQVTNVSDYL